jgi:hypothetical protein
MGKLLKFNKLKIGEIILAETERDGEFRCQVVSHWKKNIYKLKILEGSNKDKILNFEMLYRKDHDDHEQ